MSRATSKPIKPNDSHTDEKSPKQVTTPHSLNIPEELQDLPVQGYPNPATEP